MIREKPPNVVQVASIAARCQPLADFYRAYKPEVQNIFLFAEDFKLLKRWPRIAKRCGFTFHGEHIYYGSYRVTPTP